MIARLAELLEDGAKVDDDQRARLSAPALRAFHSVCDGWRLTAGERSRLLGTPAEVPLPQAALRTIAALLAIHAGLRHVHGENETTAGAWLRTPNPLDPFAGRPPLALMGDGPDGLRRLTDFLTAWRE